MLPAVLHWRVFRIWLLIRMTGRWLICLYEPESNVDVLDECSFCLAKLIAVRHAILDCPHRPDPPSGVRELQQNIRNLFDERLEGPILQKAIIFVGKVSTKSWYLYVPRWRLTVGLINGCMILEPWSKKKRA